MTIEMLHNEMVAAWKHGDMAIKNVLSNAIAQIKKAAIDAGCRDNVSEDFVNAQLLKIKKSIQEQIDTCPVNRIELLNKYNEEILSTRKNVNLTVLKAFLELGGMTVNDK